MMKKAAAVMILLILILTAVPLLAIQNNSPAVASSSNQTASAAAEEDNENTPTNAQQKNIAANPTEPSAKAETATDSTYDNKGTFKLYDTSLKKIIEVSDKEFCYGALAAEMDTSCETEALKAQAVALYSYYSLLRSEQRKKPSDELNGGDFTCDSKVWKVYVPKSELKEKWSITFDESYKIITDAVDRVFGTVLTYDGSLAKTVFHKMSSGTTESHKDIFGEDIPYLKPVASPFDMLSNNFTTCVRLSNDEFVNKAKEKWDDFKDSGNPNTLIGEAKQTDSGSVTEITLGGKKLSGQQVKDAFSLRSCNFELMYTQDQFVFTVKGYGDGVGMSQNGANEMAKQGAGYKEILNHYYPGTVLAEKYIPEF